MKTAPTRDGAPGTVWGWPATALALLAFCGAAHGQDDAVPLKPEADKSPYSLTLSVDVTTAYIYHGLIQEDTGAIIQPAALATINLYEKDSFRLDVELNAWNSVHSRKTASPRQDDSIASWYECDLGAGVVLTWDKLSVSSMFTFFTSPSGAFPTEQELSFRVDYADDKWLDRFSLNPYAMVAIETNSHAADGQDPGVYLELGIAPECTFEVWKTEVTLSFPVAVGLSLKKYYQDATGDDETFGFSSVGAKASIPLPIALRYGGWTLSAGLTAYFFGDHTAALNNDDHGKLVGTVGVQLDF